MKPVAFAACLGFAMGLVHASPHDRELMIGELTGRTWLASQARWLDGGFGEGRCFQFSRVAVMCSSPLSQSEAEQLVEMLTPRSNRRYNPDGGLWLRTATNGDVTVPGERITLTWSLVPDGTLIERSVAPGLEPSVLFATMNDAFGSEDAWVGQFRRVFQEYGELIGVDYVEEADDGAQQGAAGVVGVRGDIRISMIPINAPIRAFNYYPATQAELDLPRGGIGGDTVLNANEMEHFGDPFGDYRRLRNTVMHEHGHGLGMGHVIPLNETKLMEPSTSPAYDGPQEDDIRGFQRFYGDRFEINDAIEAARMVHAVGHDFALEPVVLENLAIENPALEDFHLFVIEQDGLIGLSLSPEGSSYIAGPQFGVERLVSARRVNDLAFDVLRSGTGEVIATVDEGGLEEEETIRLPLRAGEGPYVVRVYSQTPKDDIQRYSMELDYEVASEESVLVARKPIIDDSAGNGNGTAEPGEEDVVLLLPLLNQGFGLAENISVTLSTGMETVTLLEDTAVYSLLEPARVTLPIAGFRFNLSPGHECGVPLTFMAQIHGPGTTEPIAFEIMTSRESLGPARVYDGFMTHPPDFPGLSISEIDVMDDMPIGRIRVTLHATAEDMAEQLIRLISPGGEELVLLNGGLTGTELAGTIFADGGQPQQASMPPHSGEIRPLESFEYLASEPSAGTWQLVILNVFGGEAAQIGSWSLELSPYLAVHCEPIVPMSSPDMMSVY